MGGLLVLRAKPKPKRLIALGRKDTEFSQSSEAPRLLFGRLILGQQIPKQIPTTVELFVGELLSGACIHLQAERQGGKRNQQWLRRHTYRPHYTKAYLFHLRFVKGPVNKQAVLA
jgi:hypothetical protein